MNVNINNKWAAAIVFVLLGIFTLLVPTDEDKSNDESTSETTSTPQQEEKKDSVVINPVLDTDPYEELEDLIGLDNVKQEVKSLANFVKLQKQRQEKGMKTPKMSYHLVFTGSPGTGKTTVARIVARIYKDLGILKTGHTVETDRSGLVAEYVGQTATKTNAIVDSALNGVLFIDEAYALVPENASNDYGQEAISTLLKRMEDDRDKLVVIIAGYTNEMKRFIDSNPGLQSRFNRYINFPDYTAKELVRIFHMYMKKNQYTISDEADEMLKEKLFEKSIQMQANRLEGKSNLSDRELTEITASDIEKAFAQVK